MKKIILKKIAALIMVLSLVTVPFSAFAGTFKVTADRINVRKGPGIEYAVTGSIVRNTELTVIDETMCSDGRIWCSVTYAGGSGYVCKEYITEDKVYAPSDSDFEAWLNIQEFPDSYRNNLRALHEKYPQWVFYSQKTGLDWDTVIAEECKTGRNLVLSTSISSWKSTDEGGFDWAQNYWPGYDGAGWVQASSDVIKYYMDPRNFLNDPYIFQFQIQDYDNTFDYKQNLESMLEGTFLEGTYDSGMSGFTNSFNLSDLNFSNYGPGAPGPVTENWQYAAEDPSKWIYADSNGIRRTNGWYWIDEDRNGISECFFFDASGYLAVDCIIDGYAVDAGGRWIDENGIVQTRTSGFSQPSNKYSDLLMTAAQNSGVSPYVLAASIIQEQGKNGKSEMISGTNGRFPGVYNFYNMNAYSHDGLSAVEAGLQYASQSGDFGRPWNTIKGAVIGGALNYGSNYIKNGQDTVYLKKFNVQGTNKYNHQFMTYVAAAAIEGSTIEDAYSGTVKANKLEFKIPVYNNMPETNCPQPVKDGNPNNKLSSLYVDGYMLTPSFNMNTCEYSLIVEGYVDGINIQAGTIDRNAVINGNGYRSLSFGTNNIDITVTAQNGDIRIYKLTVIRKDDGSVSGPMAPANAPEPGNETVYIIDSSASADTNTNTNINNETVFIGPSNVSSNDIVIGEAPQ